MTVFHVVLFKIKSSLTSAEEASHLAEWTARGHAMVSQIPGLQSLELGKGLAQSLHRGQGFTHGLVAVLDGPADLPVYATHPSHLALLEIGAILYDGPPICVDFEAPGAV